MTHRKGALLGQGRTAEVYEWSEGQILKLFHPQISSDWIDYEFHLNSIIYKTGLPMPKVYEIVEVEGRRGIIYDRITGPTMLEYMVKKPWKIRSLARQLAELHYAIHQKISPELPALKPRLLENILQVDLLTPEQKEKIDQILGSLPDGNKLCHGDFHPDNVIMSEHGPIIIDWSTAMSGSSNADAVRTALILKNGEIPESEPAPIRVVLQLIRTLLYTTYVKHYLKLSQVPENALEQWVAPVAAARLTEGIPAKEKNTLLEIIIIKLHT